MRTDRRRRNGRFPVHPHPAGREHGRERRPERVDRSTEDLTDGRAVHDRAPRTGSLAGGGEQSQYGHAVQRSVDRRADTLGPMADPSTRLLVVRHGQSEWNALGRWQGQADPPLTETGMRQAVAAAEQLGTFDGVWASSLQRAAHTAAILAELLGIGPVQLDDGLKEGAFGPWQGLTVHEIEAGWPGYLASHRRPDGAESLDEISTRALDAFRRIAAATRGGEVLVVSHAGLIRSVRLALRAADIRFTNLTGCWFDVYPDGRIVAGDAVELVDPSSFGDTL